MNSFALGLPAFLKPARSTTDELWTTVDFTSIEETGFARTQIEAETRNGFLALAALAAQIFLSFRAVREIEALHLLGMVLLVVSGTISVCPAALSEWIG